MNELAKGVRGKYFRIEWAEIRSGLPALEFFMELSEGEQAKLLVLFRRLCETGKITNKEHFKKLVDGLWEFKRFQIRMLGDFRPGKRFVLALGLRKRTNKHRRKDLVKAKKILEENDLRDYDRSNCDGASR